MDSKRTKYDVLDDFVCQQTVLLQAAQALDIAAYMAIESRDHVALADIGTRWAKIAMSIAPGVPISDDESESPSSPTEKTDSESKDKPKAPIGFAGQGDRLNGRT